jgi:uncharacterized protein YbjT (DUF2867 family)
MIFVSGGTGMLGREFVRELTARGKKVAVLTRNAKRAAQRFPGIEVEFREGDVRELAQLTDAVRGADTVIGAHQFPNYPMEDPGRGHTFEEVDVRGTENLVAAAKETDVKRFIYLSAAGSSPDAPYHWFRAKWQAETAVRESGITYVIFRPTWVYGPEDTSLNRFLKMSNFLPFVPLIGRPAKQRLQPVFVNDVARAVVEAVDNPAADNQVIEIGGPEVVTMRDVARTAIEVMGRRRLLMAAPKPVMKLAGAVAQYVPGRPLTPNAVEFVTQDALADNSALEEKLGMKTTPLREGLGTYLGKK